MKVYLIRSVITISTLFFSAECMAQDQHAQKTDTKPIAIESPPANFPETEIYLFDYDATKDKNALSNGTNVTNRPGYDNQPYFTNNSTSFLYSRDDGHQTDVYEYILETKEHKRLTHSEKSEFSPTPSSDNTSISFVFERNSSIWQVDRGNENNPQWLLETAEIEEPVGYFAHNDKTGDILFWSRYGFNVSLTNANEKSYHYVAGNAVPATPHIIPDTNNFSFVHRQANGSVWIKEINPRTKAIRPLTRIVGTNANYTWAPDASIVQIDGTRVYRWKEGLEKGWMKIADLADHGIENANRVAISPDGKKIAIVGSNK